MLQLLLATDYPFLDIFWTMIIFFAWVAWIWVAISIFGDIFRRRDLGGWGKAGWVVLIIVLPFLGVLIYLIANHESMGQRSMQVVPIKRRKIFDACAECRATRPMPFSTR